MTPEFRNTSSPETSHSAPILAIRHTTHPGGPNDSRKTRRTPKSGKRLSQRRDSSTAQLPTIRLPPRCCMLLLLPKDADPHGHSAQMMGKSESPTPVNSTSYTRLPPNLRRTRNGSITTKLQPTLVLPRAPCTDTQSNCALSHASSVAISNIAEPHWTNSRTSTSDRHAERLEENV